LLVAAVGALAVAPQALAATVNVQITAAGFVPETVTINPGDTVTWTNTDTRNRQVVSQDAGFASPQLAPTATFSHTFTRSGRFTYEDPNVRPRQRGTVVVRAGVTISARPPIVTYGGTATLAGTVSSAAAGERVSVFAQACGGTFTRVADVTTTTGGAWTYAAKPLNNTVYRVTWRASTSPNVTVRVRPRLQLRKVARNRFALRVSATQSFAGKAAVFQRFNATTRTWTRVRSVTLRANNTGVAPTVVSSVTFTARVGVGRRVRAVMTQSAVGACYAAGTSNAIRS
jgi:plastocyanin